MKKTCQTIKSGDSLTPFLLFTMRRLVSSSLLLVQLMLPTTVGAASEAPLAPIFVSDPLPEFAAGHGGQETWEGHREYHRWINAQIKAWEQDWQMRQVTPPYTQVKREMLRYMLAEHRVAHMKKEAPARSRMQQTSNNATQPSVMPALSTKPRVSGRAALFKALPKESHRILQERNDKISRQNW